MSRYEENRTTDAFTCGFCGGKAYVSAGYEDWNGLGNRCDDCGASCTGTCPDGEGGTFFYWTDARSIARSEEEYHRQVMSAEWRDAMMD